MDVFTQAPPSTYMLGSTFTIALKGEVLTAIAVKTANFAFIVAAYTIIIQLLFIGLWNLISNVILVISKVDDHVKLLGLVAFWNCHDPFTAAFYSLDYFGMLILHGRTLGTRKFQYWGPALVTLLSALGTAAASIAIGILYPEWMKIAQAAPVHPDAVFWPYSGEVTNSVVSDILSYGRPGILRSLGSAEAGDRNSKLSEVNIITKDPEGSNFTHPRKQIDYSYDVTAEDFNLQGYAGLVMNIVGRCTTEYGWLHRAPGGWDEYIPWDNPENGNSFPVANGENGNVLLDFASFVHPEIDSESQKVNRSFAFAASTSQIRSFSPSSDPWYYTVASNDSDYIGAPYIIQSGRPALSCWETTEFCLSGLCYDSYSVPVSDGLAYLFKHRFNHPMSVHIGISTGVATLKSYTGSASGTMVDAHAASLSGEMTRLILASYLQSREVFHELTLSDRPTGAQNDLESPVGQLRKGADAFVVRSPDIVTMRFDLIIIAPVLAGFFWAIAGLLTLIKRNGRNIISRRAAGLSAPHMFRMLHERENVEGWTKKTAALPIPPEAPGMHITDVEFEKGGAIITFNVLSAPQNGADEMKASQSSEDG